MVAVGLLVAAMLAACGTGGVTGAPGPTSTPNATAGPRETVTVTDDGWQVLFDGSATAGLRGYGRPDVPADRWVIDDGELRTLVGAGIDLITIDQYEDFELEFEWRVAPGGNSGVLYRVGETADPAWTTGPEYQVLDDDAHPDGREPTTSAAALYALLAPGPGKRLQPVGSFNSGRIVVREGHVEHWLNGELVLEYGWGDATLRASIEGSKFAAYGGFMAQPTGHIVLQHHGEEAAFRTVRVRAIPAGP